MPAPRVLTSPRSRRPPLWETVALVLIVLGGVAALALLCGALVALLILL